LDGWKPVRNQRSRSQNVLDKWILSKLNEMVGIVTENLEKYDAFTASDAIEKFVDDFSLWYIRRSRDRVGPAAESEKDKANFYQTTYFVLHELTKIMAPFTPFISDLIYKNLTKEESVHLTEWPKYKVISVSERGLMSQMQVMRQVVEKVLSVRKESGIPVRQPLGGVKISGDIKVSDKNILKVGMDELNLKKITFAPGEEKIELDTKITPELTEEAEVRELVRRIQGERKRLGLNLTQSVKVQIDKLPVNKKLIQWMQKKAQITNLKEGSFKVTKA
jgi:isoleucyl-tRNA synthetase